MTLWVIPILISIVFVVWSLISIGQTFPDPTLDPEFQQELKTDWKYEL
jgi:hypothetical protein